MKSKNRKELELSLIFPAKYEIEKLIANFNKISVNSRNLIDWEALHQLQEHLLEVERNIKNNS